MTEKLRNGQSRPTRMRRIGSQHFVVMPTQTAQVMSFGDLERAIENARRNVVSMTAQLDRQRAFLADLQTQLAAAQALPIDRDDDDPDMDPPPAPAPLSRDEKRALVAAATADPPVSRE